MAGSLRSANGPPASRCDGCSRSCFIFVDRYAARPHPRKWVKLRSLTEAGDCFEETKFFDTRRIRWSNIFIGEHPSAHGEFSPEKNNLSPPGSQLLSGFDRTWKFRFLWVGSDGTVRLPAPLLGSTGLEEDRGQEDLVKKGLLRRLSLCLGSWNRCSRYSAQEAPKRSWAKSSGCVRGGFWVRQQSMRTDFSTSHSAFLQQRLPQLLLAAPPPNKVISNGQLTE